MFWNEATCYNWKSDNVKVIPLLTLRLSERMTIRAPIWVDNHMDWTRGIIFRKIISRNVSFEFSQRDTWYQRRKERSSTHLFAEIQKVVGSLPVIWDKWLWIVQLFLQRPGTHGAITEKCFKRRISSQYDTNKKSGADWEVGYWDKTFQ